MIKLNYHLRSVIYQRIFDAKQRSKVLTETILLVLFFLAWNQVQIMFQMERKNKIQIKKQQIRMRLEHSTSYL